MIPTLGMLMMAQQYTMSNKKDFIPDSSILQERIGNRRKLRKRRKRKKKVIPTYQNKNKWKQVKYLFILFLYSENFSE